MTSNAHKGFHPGLVDLTAGEISREIFVNEDIYAEEQERIFAAPGCMSGTRARFPSPATISCRRWARSR